MMVIPSLHVENPPSILPRSIGVFTATCAVVANVIGVDIITAPGFLARDLVS